MRGDADLKSIPVIILTTSESDDDIRAAYASHANCFISKPISMAKFGEALGAFEVAPDNSRSRAGRDPRGRFEVVEVDFIGYE